MDKDIEYYKDNPFEVEWDDISLDDLDEGIFDGKPKAESRIDAANAFANAFAEKSGEFGELAKKLKEYAKGYESYSAKAEANKKLGLKDKAAALRLTADAYLASLDNCLVDAAELIKESPEDPKADLIADSITKAVKWKKKELSAEQKAAVEKAGGAAAEAAESEKRRADYASRMVSDGAAAGDMRAKDKFAKMAPYYAGSKVKAGSGKPKDNALRGISDSVASSLGDMKGNFAVTSSDEKQMIAVAMFGADADEVKDAIEAGLKKDGVECDASTVAHTWPGFPFTHAVKLSGFRLAERQKAALRMAA